MNLLVKDTLKSILEREPTYSGYLIHLVREKKSSSLNLFIHLFTFICYRILCSTSSGFKTVWLRLLFYTKVVVE